MPVISITPVGKPRMTQRDKWKERPAVVRYRAFGDELRLKLGSNYKLPAELNIAFVLPMPKSWSKKKRTAMNGESHQQKPDIDNLCKAVMDHLCEDDSYIYWLTAEKWWGTEGKVIIADEIQL